MLSNDHTPFTLNLLGFYVMGLVLNGEGGVDMGTTLSRGLTQKLYAITTCLRIHLLPFFHTLHLWCDSVHLPPLCCRRWAGGGWGFCSSRWQGKGRLAGLEGDEDSLLAPVLINNRAPRQLGKQW
ncbi:unnamed protein product [Boreogadus saida]